MLKLTYLENGFDLERLPQVLEDWVELRVLVAMRSATAICVEPTTASFLLPMDLPYLEELEALATREPGNGIAIALCDEDYLEVSLNGTWVSSDPQGEEGAFVTALSDRAEFFLCKLWQEARSLTSALRD